MPDSAKASLYIAVLLYEARAESGHEPPLYQESFVLLQATSEEEARGLALARAREEQVRYTSAEGKTLQWSLKHLVDVSPVLDERLKSGSELYARHFRNYDAYHAFEPLLGGSVD